MVRFPPSLTLRFYLSLFLFFFNDTATTEIYTLSLHDALPILIDANIVGQGACISMRMQTAEWRDFAAALDVTLRKFDEVGLDPGRQQSRAIRRSEEHTSELQSRSDLVCRLLLEKKKQSDELHIGGQKAESRPRPRPHTVSPRPGPSAQGGDRLLEPDWAPAGLSAPRRHGTDTTR